MSALPNPIVRDVDEAWNLPDGTAIIWADSNGVDFNERSVITKSGGRWGSIGRFGFECHFKAGCVAYVLYRPGDFESAVAATTAAA